MQKTFLSVLHLLCMVNLKTEASTTTHLVSGKVVAICDHGDHLV